MDNTGMGVFHTQLFRFWYCMGFLPYLGLDDDGVMVASLVRLLRAIENQQPVPSTRDPEDSIKDIAGADWCIKNIMLDCIGKAESMLSLGRPSSTSLGGRLVEISIAVAGLLDKAREVQDQASDSTPKAGQTNSPFLQVAPCTVHHTMVPPPTTSCPPPLPAPGFSRPFNRGLPPGSGICSPAPPAWTRPEFNSDHASTGSIYKKTPSNIHTSNYTYLYYNGLINGPSPTPHVASRLPPSLPPPYPVPHPVMAGPGSAFPSPPRKLATLYTMREEYFCAVYDSSSVHQDPLFDKLRHIVPEDTFTYATSLHPGNFKSVVCCVAGWGLGNSAHTLVHDRLQGLDYAQLVRMVMLSGQTLYYTSSEIYKSTPPPPPRPHAPEVGCLFSGTVPPNKAQGPAKPPLFKVAYDALFPFPPRNGGPIAMRTNLSSGYEPPVRPCTMNPAYRKPGPTGSVGRPVLYHPPRPYSLPTGSRYGPMPIPYGVPPWRGGPVPSRKDLQNRRGKMASKGTRRSIFDNDDGDDASKCNKSESASGGTSSASSSSGSEGSARINSDDSGSGSGSDSDSPSVRRERRLLRRLSYSSLYTDSVLSDDDGKDKDKNDEDNEFGDHSDACVCLYGKGRRSKKCNSPRCIYDDMTPEELAKSVKHAQKIKARRQHSKAVVAAGDAEKEKKKAAKEKAEKEELEKEQQKEEKEKKEKEKEKQDKENRKSKLDKEEWEALSDGLSKNSGSESDSDSYSNSDSNSDKGVCAKGQGRQAKLKAIESGSVVSLSESGSDSGSESESHVESKSQRLPNPGASKVDIFAWMKEGGPSKENEAKKKDEKDKAKRRGSFVFI